MKFPQLETSRLCVIAFFIYAYENVKNLRNTSASYGPHANSVHYERSCNLESKDYGDDHRPLEEGEYYMNTDMYYAPKDRVDYPSYRVFKGIVYEVILSVS